MFQTIGIIGKYGDPDIAETLETLCDYLQQKNFTIMLDESSTELLKSDTTETVSRDTLGERCDLAIIIGGDGTFLSVARSLASYDIAFLGINLGRLGFLTDISPEDTSTLDAILSGNYQTEERLLLNTEIVRNGATLHKNLAFNDVVIHKWEVARMIEFETYVNGIFVNSQRSDGLIISTPTGSTAYALSSGGPILHPTLNAISLVPICPHGMSNRPVVIDGNSCIEILIHEEKTPNTQVSFDGQYNLGLIPGDRVIVKKYDRTVCLIHPPEHDHFRLLRAKLHWSQKL
jgi:NAD+ kinase